MSRMDRRRFSLLAAAACGAPLASLSACGGGTDTPSAERAGQAHASASTTAIEGSNAPTVVKYRVAPNATGLKIGFWEDGKRQDLTLAMMGRRPSSRVAFYNWSDLEDQDGTLHDPAPELYGAVHRYGESIQGAINVCFKIPTRYTDDIANETTREAAKAFLRHHVTWLLTTFGSATLTIDYEIVSNYLMQGTSFREQAVKWRNWCVDHAIPTARQAAADLGLQKALKLQPIFNGNPLVGNSPLALDATVIAALQDVVAACDYLALDTYFCNSRDVTDATSTIKTIRFWYETYARPCSKEVVVTENGFSTLRQWYDDGDDGGKYVGDEAQQDAYFKDLFTKLAAANRPDGVFENKLRAFHVWCIVDNAQVADLHDRKRYFGLYRLTDDGTLSPKPAAATVRRAIDTLEADGFHRPTLPPVVVDNTDLWPKLQNGKPVGLRFDEGNDHDFLRYTDVGPLAGQATLKATFALPGSLMACVNGTWRIQLEGQPTPTGGLELALPLGDAYLPGQPNTIDIYATGQVFPVRQQIQSLTLAYA